MTKRTIVGIAFVVVVASVVFAPDPVFAQRRHGERAEPHRLHVVAPQHFAPRHFIAPPFAPRPFFRVPVVRGVVVVPPLLGYAPGYGVPPTYDDTSMYAPPPPPMYGPPLGAPGGSVSITPPMPDVIEYPNGRYELRGDGINTPYKWVWIPNPPPGPPADAPAPPGPARHTQLYRWTDKDGVVHWTDRWDAVPEAYRAKATKSQS